MSITIHNPTHVKVETLFNPQFRGGIQGKELILLPNETKTFSDEEGKFLLNIYGKNQLNPKKYKDEGFLRIVEEVSEPLKEKEIPTENLEKVEIQKEEDLPKYQCSNCGKGFKSRIGLEGHKRSHKE